MKVLKFGWTSLGSLEMIQKTAQIVTEIKNNSKEDVVVVVSAMSTVTNTLIELCESAQKWDIITVMKWIDELRKKHEEVVKWICSDNMCKEHCNYIKSNLNTLHDIFKWVTLLWNISSKDKAKILYFWEILSSILLSLSINKLGYNSKFYKSADIIMCEWKFMNSDYNKDLSVKKAQDFLKNHNTKKEIPVITWFWWWDENWNIYLFDRWWSDYVATIIWNIFNANSVEIWTDVDWVMSADPRIIKNPIIWDELDYSVSAEFALTWAKVLHPKTISPAQEKNIPVYIKNTFNPKAQWTKICKSTKLSWIKWINIDNNQVLITFIDNSMLWCVWYLYSAIKIIRDNSVSIDSVATSETSFTLSIKESDLSTKLKDELYKLDDKFIVTIDVNVTKISIVWDNINDYKVLSTLDDIKLISKWEFNKTLTIFINKVEKNIILTKLHKSIFWI